MFSRVCVKQEFLPCDVSVFQSVSMSKCNVLVFTDMLYMVDCRSDRLSVCL